MGLIIFAVADEFHQKLIPGRTLSLKDIMSNVIGIVVASDISVIIFNASERIR